MFKNRKLNLQGNERCKNDWINIFHSAPLHWSLKNSLTWVLSSYLTINSKLLHHNYKQCSETYNQLSFDSVENKSGGRFDMILECKFLQENKMSSVINFSEKNYFMYCNAMLSIERLLAWNVFLLRRFQSAKIKIWLLIAGGKPPKTTCVTSQNTPRFLKYLKPYPGGFSAPIFWARRRKWMMLTIKV